MKDKQEVETLEKLIGQLQGLQSEISQLARKSPNDGINKFKLKLVNKVLEIGNTILTGQYKPFVDFDQFDEDDLPTNSDVTMILAQYIEQVERIRSDNVSAAKGAWRYVVNGQVSDIPGRAPSRVGGLKK